MTALLADAIAFVHAAIAMFVVLGLTAICLGAVLKWRWTQNLVFRTTHFAVITFIVARLILGAPCPLSVWEDNLRGHKPTGVIARLAFRGANENSFGIGCTLLFGATALFAVHSILTRRSTSLSSDAYSRASVRARIRAS